MTGYEVILPGASSRLITAPSVEAAAWRFINKERLGQEMIELIVVDAEKNKYAVQVHTTLTINRANVVPLDHAAEEPRAVGSEPQHPTPQHKPKPGEDSSEYAPGVEVPCKPGGNYGLCKTHPTCELVQKAIEYLATRLAAHTDDAAVAATADELIARAMYRAANQRDAETPYYSYRYVDKHQNPLKCCPMCQGNFLIHGGIKTEFTTGRASWTEPSKLAEDGSLHDATGTVAEGLHSQTRCGSCGESLVNMAFVEELRNETPPD